MTTNLDQRCEYAAEVYQDFIQLEAGSALRSGPNHQPVMQSANVIVRPPTGLNMEVALTVANPFQWAARQPAEDAVTLVIETETGEDSAEAAVDFRPKRCSALDDF